MHISEGFMIIHNVGHRQKVTNPSTSIEIQIFSPLREISYKPRLAFLVY
jgi:hypothetical protein